MHGNSNRDAGCTTEADPKISFEREASNPILYWSPSPLPFPVTRESLRNAPEGAPESPIFVPFSPVMLGYPNRYIKPEI